MVRAYTADLSGGNGYVFADLSNTTDLTLATNAGFGVTSNTDLDRLKITGTASALGGYGSYVSTPSENIGFGLDGASNVNLTATSTANSLNLTVDVTDWA